MDKKIEHLGKLSGPVLLFGGVYSNLQALEALIKKAEDLGISPENCICTGDIVGYCAQPEETLKRFKSWGAKSILGNVEIQLRDGKDHCGCDFREGSRCDALSQEWFPFAQNKVSKDSIEFIDSLPDHISFDYMNKSFFVVHGSFFNVSDFIFSSTEWSVKQKNFDVTNSDVIVSGHSGLPFNQNHSTTLWLNPGVIGMPANDATTQVWYILLDDIVDDMLFVHKKLDYDYKLTNELMLKNSLPKSYADTILTGLWDNMEILPEAEKMQQGKPINLAKINEKITF